MESITYTRQQLAIFVDYYATNNGTKQVLNICNWEYSPAKPWAILGNEGVALMLMSNEEYTQVMDICKEKHITIAINY